MDNIIEEWKDIDGFEGLYKVSTFGRILSVEKECRQLSRGHRVFGRTMKPRILTPWKQNSGYLLVTLRKENKSYAKTVHRLVAEAFVKQIPGKEFVNHKDGNKKKQPC
jgi:hypothetical protein